MFTSRERTTHALIALMLAGLVAVIAMLAKGAYGGPLDPPGAPGSTASVRLPGTPIDPPASPAAFPILILAPGHYYLTGPLTPPANTTAIRIEASDVSLDLGGFTVTGSGTSVVSGIFVFAVRQDVTIANGVVRGFGGRGIDTVSSTRVVVDGITASGNQIGIEVASYSVVRHCLSTLNSEEGVTVVGSFSTIEDCVVSANGFRGLNIQQGQGVVIADSQITGNNTSALADGGMLFNTMDGATVRDNDFSENINLDAFINSTSDNNIFLNNTFTCAASIGDEGQNNQHPVDTADPGTNHSHNVSCTNN